MAKRVPFKAEHVDRIKDGTKRWTSRWKDLGWKVGEVRPAVAGKNGKPAFLVPAAEAFAQLRCLTALDMFWKDFTEEHAARCGVTRDWYLRERPNALDTDPIHLYEFEEVA